MHYKSELVRGWSIHGLGRVMFGVMTFLKISVLGAKRKVFMAILVVTCCENKDKTKSPMASRLSHSPQRKGAALISVPRP